MLAGCGGGGDSSGSGTQSSAPAVKGETYSAGNISATVPEGWQAFPFYSGGEESPNTFAVHKGALNAMDMRYTPGVQIQLFPDGDGFGTDLMKAMYENVSDLAPQTLGGFTWEGFTGVSGDIPTALMWTDAGDDNILVAVWLEMEDVTISLDDADVQAIIASIKPNK